jgi:hypothetical protein
MSFANFSILKNVKIAVKKFKRGLYAKRFSELNLKILKLIDDLTFYKLPRVPLMSKPKRMKNHLDNEIFILKSGFYLFFLNIKSTFAIYFN